MFVHGDDFIVLGTREQVLWFRTGVAKIWDVKERGALGYEVNEIQILGRLARRHTGGDSLEADPKHTNILIDRAGLTAGSKGVSTPGEKSAYTGEEEPLKDGERSEYRSRCMRGSYLALDRPDLIYAVKETSRRMAEPCDSDSGKLQRIARFLLKRQRLIQEFPRQKLPKYLLVECDSDHAGCPRTRKPTTARGAYDCYAKRVAIDTRLEFCRS